MLPSNVPKVDITFRFREFRERRASRGAGAALMELMETKTDGTVETFELWMDRKDIVANLAYFRDTGDDKVAGLEIAMRRYEEYNGVVRMQSHHTEQPPVTVGSNGLPSIGTVRQATPVLSRKERLKCHRKMGQWKRLARTTRD